MGRFQRNYCAILAAILFVLFCLQLLAFWPGFVLDDFVAYLHFNIKFGHRPFYESAWEGTYLYALILWLNFKVTLSIWPLSAAKIILFSLTSYHAFRLLKDISGGLTHTFGLFLYYILYFPVSLSLITEERDVFFAIFVFGSQVFLIRDLYISHSSKNRILFFCFALMACMTRTEGVFLLLVGICAFLCHAIRSSGGNAKWLAFGALTVILSGFHTSLALKNHNRLDYSHFRYNSLFVFAEKWDTLSKADQMRYISILGKEGPEVYKEFLRPGESEDQILNEEESSFLKELYLKTIFRFPGVYLQARMVHLNSLISLFGYTKLDSYTPIKSWFPNSTEEIYSQIFSGSKFPAWKILIERLEGFLNSNSMLRVLILWVAFGYAIVFGTLMIGICLDRRLIWMVIWPIAHLLIVLLFSPVPKSKYLLSLAFLAPIYLSLGAIALRRKKVKNELITGSEAQI